MSHRPIPYIANYCSRQRIPQTHRAAIAWYHQIMSAMHSIITYYTAPSDCSQYGANLQFSDLLVADIARKLQPPNSQVPSTMWKPSSRASIAKRCTSRTSHGPKVSVCHPHRHEICTGRTLDHTASHSVCGSPSCTSPAGVARSIVLWPACGCATKLYACREIC